MIRSIANASARHLALALLFAVLAPLSQAWATCYPVARMSPSALPPIMPVTFNPDAVPTGAVRLTFLGHASFLIESAAGATAITDYNGYVGAGVTPDIVTMNNAHISHYTEFVEPGVQHVLRGWANETGLERHDVTVEDMRVRNILTNVRETGGTRWNGNSIFVFEVADLCIAHLGHLHHTLSDQDLGELGVIDVLLVPVDGAYTMAQEMMVQVIHQINAPLVIPMHYFNRATLSRFLGLIRHHYEVEFREEPTVLVSRSTLPRGQVLVLPGI